MAKKPRKKPKPKYQDTSIELAIEALLIQHAIPYRKQEFLHNIVSVDFYLPDSRVAIECDGCYWHGCPTHHPRRKVAGKDHMRTRILTDAGYVVLRFWEHDINSRPDWCIKRILKYANRT